MTATDRTRLLALCESQRQLLASALRRLDLIEQELSPTHVGYVIEVSRVQEQPR